MSFFAKWIHFPRKFFLTIFLLTHVAKVSSGKLVGGCAARCHGNQPADFLYLSVDDTVGGRDVVCWEGGGRLLSLAGSETSVTLNIRFK